MPISAGKFKTEQLEHIHAHTHTHTQLSTSLKIGEGDISFYTSMNASGIRRNAESFKAKRFCTGAYCTAVLYACRKQREGLFVKYEIKTQEHKKWLVSNVLRETDIFKHND